MQTTTITKPKQKYTTMQNKTHLTNIYKAKTNTHNTCKQYITKQHITKTNKGSSVLTWHIDIYITIQKTEHKSYKQNNKTNTTNKNKYSTQTQTPQHVTPAHKHMTHTSTIQHRMRVHKQDTKHQS